MLKETLKNIDGKNNFLEILYSISLNDSPILEIESIRAAIEFKWNNIARSFFIPHFLLIIAFIILFIIDQSMINSNSIVKENLINTDHTALVILRFTQLGTFLFPDYEWRQRKLGKMTFHLKIFACPLHM